LLDVLVEERVPAMMPVLSRSRLQWRIGKLLIHPYPMSNPVVLEFVLVGEIVRISALYCTYTGLVVDEQAGSEVIQRQHRIRYAGAMQVIPEAFSASWKGESGLYLEGRKERQEDEIEG
jgi:hypothetical protein